MSAFSFSGSVVRGAGSSFFVALVDPLAVELLELELLLELDLGMALWGVVGWRWKIKA
ncbi:MAG: hypothetical protein AAF685_03180 [Cyanobacteria bacterium P01_C01_bin.89]